MSMRNIHPNSYKCIPIPEGGCNRHHRAAGIRSLLPSFSLTAGCIVHTAVQCCHDIDNSSFWMNQTNQSSSSGQNASKSAQEVWEYIESYHSSADGQSWLHRWWLSLWGNLTTNVTVIVQGHVGKNIFKHPHIMHTHAHTDHYLH